MTCIVVQFGWLTAVERVDALGLAETTPGPLVLVTQFVVFLAGFKEGGFLLALSAATVALWVTVGPCFLWIFAGAPYIEWILRQPRLNGALKSIAAAVVGVILSLSIWFALRVLFSEVSRYEIGPITIWRLSLSTVHWLTVGLFLLSALLAFRMHWGIMKILLVTSLLGVVLRLAI